MEQIASSVLTRNIVGATAEDGSIDGSILGPRVRLILRGSASPSPVQQDQSTSNLNLTQGEHRHRCARLAIDVAISNVFGVGSEGLWHGTRGVKDVAEARQVAMYLAHVCCRMTLTEVGAMFGRDRTTVAHACLKVECRRDNPAFDRALDVLGWALPTLVMHEVRSGAEKSSLHTKDQ
ncbi:helix-turn-helix domain-containing protein [Hyphomicrobium sp.]|uniref:helix-turn-helix domain-containing protein n=1 Tax=Hyphomicrobium sp. TaxID=82 RepID=UPI0025BDF4DB|nr:helix-turn-helix domain-containing protein [Hyphomicrobium sp.]